MEQFSTYQYIQNQASMLQAAVVLRSCKEVAIDLEFDRDRYAYGFTLCLIQIHGKGISYLFDPFVGLDFGPVFDILEDETIVKVLHSPGEDLQLLHKMGCFPKNMFDTERSARILNYSAFSLSNLLNDILGIQLDKSQQKSNWTRSPLSETQLKYAASDVAHLISLKDELQLQAMQKGVMDWLKEENAAWDDYRVEEKPDGHFANKEDSKKLPPFQLHVYNAVLGLRDKIAQELNKPGYQIIPKELAMDVVFKPELVEDWMNQKGLNPRVKTLDFKRQLKQVIEIAQQEATERNLLKRNPGSHLSPAQRVELANERVRIAALVDSGYRKVWQVIADRYGEFTAAYFLNERTMTDLTTGAMKLEDLPYRYRGKLIEEISAELKLVLSA